MSKLIIFKFFPIFDVFYSEMPDTLEQQRKVSNLETGANVMITIFGDFSSFRRKNSGFLKKTIHICNEPCLKKTFSILN
jgi:hypothetical protein